MSAFNPITIGGIPRYESRKLNTMDSYDLEKWVESAGSSVYVHWVPDELTEEVVTSYFTNRDIAKVDRVDFVPKYDANRKQIGRMMFVHFKYWISSEFASKVAAAHPEPYIIKMAFGKFGPYSYDQKFYEIKYRVNCRPIEKVEYNTHQLTDMFERLNERVMNEIGALRAENANLKIMIEKLIQPIRDEAAAAIAIEDTVETETVKEEPIEEEPIEEEV